VGATFEPTGGFILHFVEGDGIEYCLHYLLFNPVASPFQNGGRLNY
jgi:hypothetical protein